MIKSGQDWAGIFATYDSDGSLKAPSSGPTGTLYIDGTSNAATVTITGSNPYKFSVTLPTLTAGQRVDMYITATLSSIATAAVSYTHLKLPTITTVLISWFAVSFTTQ